MPTETPSISAPKTKALAFAARGTTVFHGAKVIARVESGTMARRIANALNAYQPDPKGR